ncbi:uncharacterized protein DUF4367 [Ureibacillus xyleni]|uniref:Uncharacterized protein DUF4367 n=1 Tax=Ureibacillus xyleni TaxID=614648 RepID=A0A285T6M0_9BACL|nr:DUF4367 domain-containing protein [Ureibacillus xyleni]SOC16674.1 uncharacterized protein DUF4367 [Ureibacillus xyleni]
MRKGNKDVSSSLDKGEDEFSELKNKGKWRWFHMILAFGIIIVSAALCSFSSPTMADMFTKIPGLSFMYSGTYEDVPRNHFIPSTLNFGTIAYGENGPFNKEVQDLVFFEGYTAELEKFVGFPVPQLGTTVNNIRVNKYDEGEFLIKAFAPYENGAAFLSIVTNPISTPTITGTKKDSVKINNSKANVYTYQISKNVSEETYIIWEHDKLLFVLASSGIPFDQLIKLAKKIDQQC